MVLILLSLLMNGIISIEEIHFIANTKFKNISKRELIKYEYLFSDEKISN